MLQLAHDIVGRGPRGERRGNRRGGAGCHLPPIGARRENFCPGCTVIAHPPFARADDRRAGSPRDELHASNRRKFTGRTCNPHPSAATVAAINLAYTRADRALHEGRLISPVEALAPALGAAREKETLYSIARALAWETGGELEDILCSLGER